MTPNSNSISSSPRFIELVRLKNGLSGSLAAIALIMFFGYLMLVALNPAFIGARVGDSRLTWGIVLGIGNVIGAIVLTGAYVVIANGRIDELTRQLTAEARS